MSTSLPVVAVVGINGRIGKHVLNALVSPAFKDKISLPIHLATGNVEKTKAVPAVAASPESFKIFAVDIATGEGLDAAFAGVTVVCNTVGVTALPHAKIADAAAAAKVKVYVPAEFGSAYEGGALGKYEPLFKTKMAATEYARSKPFKTIFVANGLVTELAFGVPGIGGFTSDTALTTYEPDAGYATTSYPDVGRAVAAIAAKSGTPAALPDVLYVRGDVLTGKKVAEIYTKVTGKKVDLTVEPAAKLLEPAAKIVAVGHPQGPTDFPTILRTVFTQGHGNVTPNYEKIVDGAFEFETAEDVAKRLFK